jgi:phospholipase D1/2
MEEHEKPQSLECARAMLALGRRSWQAYIDPTPGPLPCHLMAYPVDVGSAGSVNPLPGSATFPDLGGNVVGTKGMLPPLLTT